MFKIKHETSCAGFEASKMLILNVEKKEQKKMQKWKKSREIQITNKAHAFSASRTS